jgi:hypothetical protein
LNYYFDIYFSICMTLLNPTLEIKSMYCIKEGERVLMSGRHSTIGMQNIVYLFKILKQCHTNSVLSGPSFGAICMQSGMKLCDHGLRKYKSQKQS